MFLIRKISNHIFNTLLLCFKISQKLPNRRLFWKLYLYNFQFLTTMVEPVAQTPAAQPTANEAQMERQMALKYQQLQRETNALVQRLMEVEDEKRENE